MIGFFPAAYRETKPKLLYIVLSGIIYTALCDASCVANV